MVTDDMKFCKCEGRGCMTCRGFGWVYADGLAPRECRPGVACSRVIQCEECPHVEELTGVKPDGDQEDG